MFPLVATKDFTVWRSPAQVHSPQLPSLASENRNILDYSRTFRKSFYTATSTSPRVRDDGVGQGGMCSPRLDLYAKTCSKLPLNFSLLYADDTSITATFRQSKLLVIYVDTDCNNLEHWLQEWFIMINVYREGQTIC